MNASQRQRFERLYSESADPWSYRTSTYERDKYAATLAALGRPSYDRCLEVGCSIGVFTHLLAARCRHLVAIDFSPTAVDLAGEAVGGLAGVELLAASFPEEAPPGPWDLVVCSEVLYYLQAPALDQAIRWLQGQLVGGTSVLAVSWRGRGRDEPVLGDEVHDRLARHFTAWHVLDARRPEYRLDRFDGR